MKKILMMALLGVAAIPVVAQTAAAKSAESKATMTLADARSRIDAVIETPKLMGEIMKSLSAEDQKKFLADVNKAIGELPASVEEKTAKYLNINHIAVTSAQEGNTLALLAEVFATVPPESLTVINERFASDLMSRTTKSGSAYTDEQFLKMSLDVMKAVVKRTSETDNGSTRSTFAALMLIRASNGTPTDLTDKLVDLLETDEAKELAKEEWIPAALGKDGRELGYEPILASADAGRRPDFAFVLVIAGPQYLDSILEDIFGKNTDRMAFIRTRSPVLDAVENPLIHQIPTLDGDVFGSDIIPQGDVPDEPRPYNWQK